MNTSSTAESRSYKRLSLGLDCELVVEGRRVPCKALNGSAGGLRLTPEARRGLLTGAQVSVEFKSFGAFDAVVVWAADGDVGLRFEKDTEEMLKVIESMALYGLG